MPSVKVGDQIAVQLQAVGNAVINGQKEAVNRASFILKSAIEGELQRAIGGDQEMSNVRTSISYSRKTSTRRLKEAIYSEATGSSARLGIRYDVKGQLNPTALLRAFGPWGLVEYNVGPHRIFPRLDGIQAKGMKRVDFQYAVRQRNLNQAYGARGTYRGVRPMPVGAGVFRYSALHPGTTGKRPFAKGMAKSEGHARQELNLVVLRGVATVWKYQQGRKEIVSFRAN